MRIVLGMEDDGVERFTPRGRVARDHTLRESASFNFYIRVAVIVMNFLSSLSASPR
jgi:hypothetical protein